MVSLSLNIYLLAKYVILVASESVETNKMKDATAECWEEGMVEEILDYNDKPVVQIRIEPVGGHNRQHSANCTILVSTAEHPSALSLAILHLQFSRKAEGEVVTVTTAANEKRMIFCHTGPLSLLLLTTGALSLSKTC